jgi:hypothetical protein
VAPFVGSDEREVRVAAVLALVSFGDVDHVLRGLESDRVEVRESTFGVLNARARGESFGYDHRLPPDEQTEAIRRWAAWLTARAAGGSRRDREDARD